MVRETKNRKTEINKTAKQQHNTTNNMTTKKGHIGQKELVKIATTVEK